MRYSSNPISYTKTGKSFRICIIPESAMFIDLPSNEQTVRKTNLERVVDLISQRPIIGGPSDYRRLFHNELLRMLGPYLDTWV